jgi:D-alanyl-D-alanine carboxypeptidase (penicillin-binding protein 5/6)
MAKTNNSNPKYFQKKQDSSPGGWGWLGVVTIAVVAAGMTVLIMIAWWQRSGDKGETSDGKTGSDGWSWIGVNSAKQSPTPELPAPEMLPEIKSDAGQLELTAVSYLAIDVPSVTILTAKEEDRPWPPASITKVMTATVALDNYPLDEVVKVGNYQVEGQKIDLIPGEEISVEDLLYGMLVESGNDAAEALARHDPKGRDAFIEKMNEKAKLWHLDNTRFVNPSGIDDNYHFSTALDLARLTTMALHNEEFDRIIATEEKTVTSIDGTISHQLKTTNQLLNQVDGVKGVKTGWTEESGESLVILTERDGHRVLTVMLGSQDRFGETKQLIEWVFANTEWRKIG